MADLNFQATVGEISVTSTAKSFIILTAPANQRVRIKGVECFGKGTSNADTPVKLELVKAASLTGGTAGTVPTSTPLDPDYAETIQTSITGNYTAEPTYNSSAVMRTWEVHPQTGLAIYFPMHDEIKLKGGSVIGFRLTANQTETMALNVICEE
jgi:hypothetical protein